MKNKASLISLQKRIGEKMIAMRKEMGNASSEQFAFDCGLGREQYRRLEKGIGNPRLRTLAETVEAAFDLSIEDFFESLFEKPSKKKPSPKK
ncbi:helix-turn-helix transcriptional regulator [Dawidia soli]|uniref:Helix-turn-helix domain-containing protein n=1 Tax=Dawidia soli TaxID=2782352 RepID=A0AAP2GIS5_9BACT|nr:helix-turn-helix transcriptional regulator [Dawidia soli]MBT1687248.1 helix-turn-helix domain-containing protein [Dawidia soli]